MRLISQDGMYDFPYETVVLRMRCCIDKKRYSIVASSSCIDSHWDIGIYSSKEKAEKAMEMLREQYAHMKRVECMSASLASCDVSTLSNKDAKLLGNEVQKLMCFQFPQDEDVEV